MSSMLSEQACIRSSIRLGLPDMLRLGKTLVPKHSLLPFKEALSTYMLFALQFCDASEPIIAASGPAQNSAWKTTSQQEKENGKAVKFLSLLSA